MLGHMYSAEALVMLDRITEARTFLEPKFIAELKEDDFIHRGSPGKIFTNSRHHKQKKNSKSIYFNRLEYKYKGRCTINFKVQFSSDVGSSG